MTFRVASLAFLVSAILPPAIATTQLPGVVPREKEPPAQQRMREQQVPMMVRGCIRGRRLLLTEPSFNGNVADILNADAGVSERSGVTASVRQPVRFRVTGVQHLHEGCTRL